MSPEEIKKHWRECGAAAAAAGTWTHAQCECVLNGGHVTGECTEMSIFRHFLGSTQPLLAYRTEWVIWAEEEGLAGCIDFAALDMKGHLVLYDWKRTKNLQAKYTNQWRHLREPLSHLEDAAGIKYRLQLNVYRWILEEYYGMTISAMFVVCLHPDLRHYPFVDAVPDMQEDVRELMRLRRLARTAASSSAPPFQDVWGAGVDVADALQFFKQLGLHRSRAGILTFGRIKGETLSASTRGPSEEVVEVGRPVRMRQ